MSVPSDVSNAASPEQEDDYTPARMLCPAFQNFKNSTSSFYRRRPLFWLTLIVCIGICADARWTPALTPLIEMQCASVLAAAAILFLGFKRSWIGASHYSVFMGGCCIAFCGGMFLHAMQSRIPALDDISRQTPPAPSFVCLQGTIIEASRGSSTAGGQKAWVLSVDALGEDGNSLRPASGRVKINVREGSRFEPAGAAEQPLTPRSLPLTSALSPRGEGLGEGDLILLRARIEGLPEWTIPDSFDYGAYLKSQGIQRVGLAFQENIQHLAPPSWTRPDLILRRLSSWLALQVETLLPNPIESIIAKGMGEGETPGRRGVTPSPITNNGLNNAVENGTSSQAALLNALLFGRRERLDVSDREAFALSGTAHLLAISGLQIQFLAFLLWRVAALFAISKRRSAAVILLISCAYCALAGADAPIMRATIMIVIFLGAIAFGRESDPLSVLAASALVILMVTPSELFNAGFQLSFLAVLALVTLYPALEEAWATWKKSPFEFETGTSDKTWRTWAMIAIRQAFFVSLAATLGTAPAVAWHMGRFATYSLVINLIAVPLSNMCMIGGLVMLPAAFISSSLATFLGWVPYALICGLQGLTSFFAAIPAASIDLPAPPVVVLVIYAAILAWIWIERGRKLRLWHLSVSIPACFLMLHTGLLFREHPAFPSVTILDLKNGHAVLVESTGSGTDMINAGGIGQGARIADLLRRRGITHLGQLVLNADKPDAMGGAKDLLRHISVGRVVFPRAASASNMRRELEGFLTERGVAYGPPAPGSGLVQDVRWDFLNDGPPATVPVGSETTLSIRLTFSEKRFLFVSVHSAASAQRFLKNTPPEKIKADIVCLWTARNERLPAETARILEQSDCRIVITNDLFELDETSKFDLPGFAQSHHLQLISLHAEGSLRLQTAAASGMPAVAAYHAGKWREIKRRE